MKDSMRGAYDDLASEYYDASRHPTCANFRDASAKALRECFSRQAMPGGFLCEVGAGDSLLAIELEQRPERLRDLLITDSSPSMLAYSERWRSRGARLAVAEASLLPTSSDSLQLLVSSLGDPYNDASFWREARRVLAPGGRLIFTTPSYEWVSAFRKDDDATVATFVLSDGCPISVPSLIQSVLQQTRMIEAAQLVVTGVITITLSAIDSARLSPKLLPQRGPSAPVLTAYDVVKPAQRSRG